MINFENQEKLVKKTKIPLWELDISFARSGGPGGQKVNKASTKAVLHFNIKESKTLNEEQKNIILTKFKNDISNKGEIVLYDQTTRSQWQNRANIIKKFNEMINEALLPEKERISTKISGKEKEKRLIEKKVRSKIKEARRERFDW